MLKRILPILLISAVFLTACGSAEPVTPTPDIPLTAAAAAATIVAQTAAAVPPTPLPPPTEMPTLAPPPTFTPDPLLFPPTLAFPTLPSTPTQSSSGDPCDHILNTGDAGVSVTGKYIRFENTTNGTATIWLTLTSPNSFGQCGYLTGFNNILKKGARLKLRIPSGCWLIGAWVEGKNGKSQAGPITHCLGDSKADEVNRILIKDYTINWVGP